MSRLRPVPDRAGDGGQHALRLRTLRNAAAGHACRSDRPLPGAHLHVAGAVCHPVAVHADEGLDSGHRARDDAALRTCRAGASRPVASGHRRFLHHCAGAAHQVCRNALRAGRPADADRAAQPARRLPDLPPHGHMGNARGAVAGRVRGLHQAGRPGHDRAGTGGLCAWRPDCGDRLGRARARSAGGVGRNRASRPDPCADATARTGRIPARRCWLRGMQSRLRAGGA